jgi:phosphoribosylamine--glycine ligase
MRGCCGGWTKEGPKVIEFNVRLGDPEAQALAVQDSRDWGKLIAYKLGLLPNYTLEVSDTQQVTLGVVMAAHGYHYDEPAAKAYGEFSKNLFTNQEGPVHVFGASLAETSNIELLRSAKGRVLTVVGKAHDFKSAREAVYLQVAKLAENWHGRQFRNDIGLHFE